MRVTIALMIFLLWTTGARSEVVDAAPSGFTVRTAVQVRSTSADAYRTLVEDIGAWWDSEHTFSGDARNLSIEAKANGCFCEKLPSGGGVHHAAVVFADPGKTLRLVGGLGPLQSEAVTGTLTFSFTPGEAGTEIGLTYRVGGYLPEGLETWAAPVDGVLSAQMTRLRLYIETGKSD